MQGEVGGKKRQLERTASLEARRSLKAAASSLKTKVQYSLIMVCSRQHADPSVTVCGMLAQDAEESKTWPRFYKQAWFW